VEPARKGVALGSSWGGLSKKKGSSLRVVGVKQGGGGGEGLVSQLQVYQPAQVEHTSIRSPRTMIERGERPRLQSTCARIPASGCFTPFTPAAINPRGETRASISRDNESALIDLTLIPEGRGCLSSRGISHERTLHRGRKGVGRGLRQRTRYCLVRT